MPPENVLNVEKSVEKLQNEVFFRKQLSQSGVFLENKPYKVE